MEYNRVTAILLILLSTMSAVSIAGGGPSGTMPMFFAIVATMAAVAGAGMAWTKASPWVVLALVAAAAVSAGLSTATEYRGVVVEAPYYEEPADVQEPVATAMPVDAYTW